MAQRSMEPTTPSYQRVDVGLLVLRLVAGIVLIVHGTQKLFGWFGGAGLGGATKLFAALGFAPPKPFAVLASLTEMSGGILFVLGLAMPLASAAIIGNFLNATVSVIPAGFLKSNGDFAALLGATAIVLALTGAGAIALDRGHRWLPKWIEKPEFSIGLGLAAGGLMLIVRALR